MLVYKNFDQKDKVASVVRYTIRTVKTVSGGADITYLYEVSDRKEKPVYQEEVTVKSRGSKIFYDMSAYVNKGAFQQNGRIPSDVQVRGNNLEVPTSPRPGETLPDAFIELAMEWVLWS